MSHGLVSIGKIRHNSRIESSLGCMKCALLCTKKLNFVSLNWRKEKNGSVACGFSPIKVVFSDYPKSLIVRINEVYVFFNKISL